MRLAFAIVNHDHRQQTKFLKPSPSLETASCAATQELTQILWIQKIHYRVHKSHPLAPILNQMNPVNTTQFLPLLKSV
jgi:hypothetical protein